MRIVAKSFGHLLGAGAAGVVAFAVASCSSSNSGNGNASPATLVSTCDSICNNLAPCANASLDTQCLSVCDGLNVVPASCLDPLASYLACLAGAKSVSCQAGGQYVLVTPPECEDDRQAWSSCNAGPSVIAACVQLATNAACAGPAPGDKAVFCVGAPSGCVPVNSNPLGIGRYCCP